MDYRHELYRKEKGRFDIAYQSTYKYDKECKYLGSHKATPEEIEDMLNSVNRKCSYT